VVSKVVEQPIVGELQVVGTVEPFTKTTLSAEIAGLTERFDLRAGEYVEKDKTVICQLNDDTLRIMLAEAEGLLAKAKAEAEKLKRGLRPEEIEERRAAVNERKALLKKYEDDLERSKDLYKKKVISNSDYILAESNYLAAKHQLERATYTLRLAELGSRQEEIAAAEAEVRRMQANYHRIQDDLRKTSIRSPISGFIVQKHTEVGQWVEKGGKVADLIDIGKVLVRIGVNEREIKNIRIGDEAILTLDAYPGEKFQGKVQYIIPQADVTSRNFPVQIAVENTPDSKIKSGMFARATIKYGSQSMALLVPKDAVVRQGEKELVFTVKETDAQGVPVVTGRIFDGFVEVLQGGLTPGQEVVVVGNERLRDGAKVIIKEKR
jgi:multidrug efflux pump subunit AcrA (membrane-fusion protein)